jgi:hypothetical protein
MKTTHHLITVLALFLLAAVPQGALASGQFLSAIDDLPLMAGLEEVDGGMMVFDSASGRLVEVLTTGYVGKGDVLRYYSETLPQLGWLETGPGQFSREGEMLRLEFPPAQALSGSMPAPINVRFMLSPDS